MQRDEAVYDYYQKLAGDYDEDRFENSYGRYIHKQEETILSRYTSNNNESFKTLSLGCGTGRFMEYATYGLDRAPNMVEVARKKYPEKSFVVSDATRTEFEDDEFDMLFSFHLFMHLDRDKCKDIIHEAYRITRPGGKFIFDVPSAKRRNLTNHKQEGWHGATHFSIDELQNEYFGEWKMICYKGVLFFPIHRVHSFLRNHMEMVDTFLCSSWMREYASYLVVVLEKK